MHSFVRVILIVLPVIFSFVHSLPQGSNFDLTCDVLLDGDDVFSHMMHSGVSSASFMNILNVGPSSSDMQKSDFSPPHSPSVAQTLP